MSSSSNAACCRPARRSAAGAAFAVHCRFHCTCQLSAHVVLGTFLQVPRPPRSGTLPYDVRPGRLPMPTCPFDAIAPTQRSHRHPQHNQTVPKPAVAGLRGSAASTCRRRAPQPPKICGEGPKTQRARVCHARRGASRILLSAATSSPPRQTSPHKSGPAGRAHRASSPIIPPKRTLVVV